MSTLIGKSCHDLDLIHSGFEAVILHAVEVLCFEIDENESCTACCTKTPTMRNYIAAMLNKLPVTCRFFRGVARGDTRYAAVLFYERTRLGAAASGHFLEALPQGLSLFSGETGVVLNDADLKKLKLRDIVADRVKTVSSLEALHSGTDRLQQLVHDNTLSDLPSGLPGRVYIFVSRMRAICQGLRRVKPEAHFKSCRNRECCRLFYKGAVNETSAPQDERTSPNYWEIAAGGPEISDEQADFCTFSCCQQWRWQLNQALPSMMMTADYDCRKSGRARVPEALRLVGKRNENTARHLRTIQKTRREFLAISSTELQKFRARLVRTLNIDLGLLYAASVLADSKSLSANKVLPGATEHWRSRPAFYAKSIREVAKLYEKHHKGGNVISNMVINEPFLTKLREKAGTVF